jgi:hypothetical protein
MVKDVIAGLGYACFILIKVCHRNITPVVPGAENTHTPGIVRAAFIAQQHAGSAASSKAMWHQAAPKARSPVLTQKVHKRDLPSNVRIQ